MGDLAVALFSSIWEGIRSLPFFDFGFTFDKYILGAFILSFAILIFRSYFNPDGSMTSRMGLDVRQHKVADFPETKKKGKDKK